MARTDAHRPSVIDPLDYEFVAFEYLRVDGLEDAIYLQHQRAMYRAHMARTGGTYSGHEHGGNCHICGSVNAIYTALFYHEKTNSYVRTGLDCAERLECSEVNTFKRTMASALEAKAGKRKAQAVLEQAGLVKAWEVFNSADEGRREEEIIRDIVGKLVQYGNLSVPQLAFVRKLVDAINNRAAIDAKRAAEAEAAAPLPVADKRITIVGTVRSIKVPNYNRGECGPVRMLVQHKDGWKVWGSVPSNILEGLTVGRDVSFSATIKPSDRDTKFGFFSRPTKATVLELAA